MEKIVFNHEASNLRESFDLSQERSDKLETAIVFESIAAHSIATKNYDDVNDAPRVLRTKTGVLSRALQYAADERERVFLSFIFINRHEAVNQLLGIVLALDGAASDANLKKKLIEAGSEAFGSKLTETELLEHFESTLRKKLRPLKPFLNLVRQVENSNYDFMLFNALIDEEEPSGYAREVVEESLHVCRDIEKSGLFKKFDEEDGE